MRKVLFVLLMAGLAFAQDFGTQNRDAESKVGALERLAKLQAVEAKDLKTLADLLDDDFVCVDPKGTLLTKTDLLGYVSSAQSMRYLIQDVVVRIHGNTAVATGMFDLKAVVGGKPLSLQGRFIDTWLLKNGRWVAIASVSAPSK